MRYLDLIYSMLPTFPIFAALGLPGTTSTLVGIVFGLSAVGGLVLGVFMSRSLHRNLFYGESNFLIRPFPGGKWFVVGVSAVGATLMLILLESEPAGENAVRYSALAFGTSMTMTWGSVAFYTRRIERIEAVSIYMGNDRLIAEKHDQSE